MTRAKSQGYALITTLILVVMTTALMLGLIGQVNTEQLIARSDLYYPLAFYGAEAGLEKLNSDLSKLFQQSVFPSAAQIASIQVEASRPAIASVTYPVYQLVGGQSTRLTSAMTAAGATATVTSTAGWPETGYLMIDSEEMTYSGLTATTFTGLVRAINGTTAAQHAVNATVSRSRIVTIAEGPTAGLSAHVIPFDLQAVARTTGGTEAMLHREVQVALIPVFQFGVFSDSDLSFFAGPSFNFGGRVHSNKNLFLAHNTGATLTLAQRVTTAGQVIRTQLANGFPLAGSGRLGTINVVTTPGSFRHLANDEGSLVDGPGSAANPSWPVISLSTYNGNILSASTGGRPLTLPFAGGDASPIEIIRRPPADEEATGLLGQSRLYNQASLRIIITDTAATLPGGSGYPLSSALESAPYNYTVQTSPLRPRFAAVDTTVDNGFFGPDNTALATGSALIGGFILIEMQEWDGTWTDVTMEILNLGIATNQPNSIVRFQRPRPGGATGSTTASEYWPINLFDAREGRFRDTALSGPTKLGIMNVVEVDVNNLRRWFDGDIGSSGDDAVSNNGYILYFSDRRGNRDAAGEETGIFGFEDFVNPGDAAGAADGVLNTGEDVNGDGVLQTYGANLPYSPYSASTELHATPVPVTQTTLPSAINSAVTTINVNSHAALPARGYVRIDNEILTYTGKANSPARLTGVTRGQFGTSAADHAANAVVANFSRAAKNRVYYFRRAIKLVNGTAPNLPTPGFTVASENPVYVKGDYNANGNFSGDHSYAAVIADSVTLLSNSWDDLRSFEFPYDQTKRPASQTWFRMAIAGGKGLNFPRPNWSPLPAEDFGTDGGVHNFLRYLENWGGVTANYRGSLVSLYYSHQGVGIYKCCAIVYGAPTRAYAFDTDFLVPSQLPPGTPRFRDINNLSFRQTIRATD